MPSIIWRWYTLYIPFYISSSSFKFHNVRMIYVMKWTFRSKSLTLTSNNRATSAQWNLRETESEYKSRHCQTPDGNVKQPPTVNFLSKISFSWLQNIVINKSLCDRICSFAFCFYYNENTRHIWEDMPYLLIIRKKKTTKNPLAWGSFD